LVIVGDASMSPYEVMEPGGSVEHWNEEAGVVWLKRLVSTWRRAVWINPVKTANWGYTQSIAMIRDVMEQRMYPLTLAGLDEAVGELSH
jgi:uncharacterized protein with von Willebrand factor type A (vWA) domain